MGQPHMSADRRRRSRGLALLLFPLLFLLLFGSPVFAQETPDGEIQTPEPTLVQETPEGTVALETPEATQETPETEAETPEGGQETPDGDATPVETDEEPTPGPGEAVIRLEIEAVEEPVPAGEEFTVIVLVDNVERLGGFDFIIGYDPDRVRPVGADGGDGTPAELADPTGEAELVAGQAGALLAQSERGENLSCNGPFIRETAGSRVFAECFTVAPPTCLGGPAGASGSGELGRVVFESRGGDMTTLQLVDSTLSLDDIEPCDSEGRAVPIPHSRQDATVLLSGGGGVSGTLIGIIIGVVVLVAVVGAVGGYLWYQRRGRTAA